MLGYKLAAHAHDRIEERSTLSRSLVDEAQKRIAELPKDGSTSYHWTARQGDQVLGHLAVRRVGKDQKPVVTTFLGPQMKPSGVELSDQLGPLLPAEKAADGGKLRLFTGLKVKVDRPKGFVQEGKDSEGKPWKRVYKVDYGYFPKTEGGDGEDLDVFLGPDEKAPTGYLIYQKKADGSFDELKLMMGFADADKAKACYLDHVPAKFFGKMEPLSLNVVKALLGYPLEGMKIATEAFVPELLGAGISEGKLASTRYEREIAHGNILRSDVAPVAPVDSLAPFLAPAARKATREHLIAPAELPDSEVELRRRVNEKRNLAYRTPQGHGLARVTVESGAHPGLVAGTNPDFMLGGAKVHMPDKGMASFFKHVQDTGPFDQARNFVATAQAAAKGEGPGVALHGLAMRRYPNLATDPALTYATLRHELGEAEESRRLVESKGVRPFASHLGTTPILREQEALLGDPQAIRDMAQVRQMNPGDARVQKLIRQVGGTPDSPLPLGGRQHAALNRRVDARPDLLDPQGRGLAANLGAEHVPYVPKSLPKASDILEEATALKSKKGLDVLRGGLDLAKRGKTLIDFVTKGK